MPLQFQQRPMPSQPSGANLMNLGFQNGSKWGDSSPQNAGTGAGYGTLTGNAMSPRPGATGQNPVLQNFMSSQTAENQRSRGANEGRWNDASSFLKQFTTPFSPDVIARMKAQNAMLAQGGATNAFREQQGLMDASGQGDASSLAAAAAEANRHRLGAQVGANNQLGIQAAQANNAAGLQVGNSLLSNLPQDRPDNMLGYAQLQMMDQQNQFNNGLTQNIMDRPQSPGMTNQRPSMGGQGGQNYLGAQYNPNGAGPNQMNQWTNGGYNGNPWLPTPRSQPYQSPGAMNPGWGSFQNGAPQGPSWEPYTLPVGR